MSTPTKTRPDDTTTPEDDTQRLRRLCDEIATIRTDSLPPVSDGGERNAVWQSVDAMLERLREAREFAEADAEVERQKIVDLCEKLLKCDFSKMPSASSDLWAPVTALSREIRSAMASRRMI